MIALIEDDAAIDHAFVLTAGWAKTAVWVLHIRTACRPD